MAESRQIKTALISVFHKDGLEDLLKKLNEEGVKFLSTGGTQKFIESLGYDCQKVEEVTTYPWWPCEDSSPEDLRWNPCAP